VALYFIHFRYGRYIKIIYLLVVFFLLVSYYLTHHIRKYVLYSDKIIIKRFSSKANKKIIFSDIEHVQRFTIEDFKNSKRLSSVSFFGYFSDYSHPVFGYFNTYATNRNNMIMIKTKESRTIVISPDNLELLEALNKAVANNKD